jgi:hypothetical protein
MRAWRQLARQEPQQEKRRRIGGVQIVDDHHERVRLAACAQEGGDRVEQPETRTIGIERRSRGQPGEQLVKLGKHLGDVRRAGSELSTDLLPVVVTDVRAKGLCPWPVSRGPACLPAAAPEDLHTPRFGQGRRLVREEALADARFAGDQKERRPMCEGALQAACKLSQLGRAPDESASRACDGGLGRLDKIEPRVLLEDGLVEAAEPRPRLDANLVHEDLTRVAICLQGVRLSARAIQRKHALGVQLLAQGVLLDQRLQLDDEFAMAPGGKVAVDGELECVESPPLKTARLGRRERLRDVGQGRTSPKRQRLARRAGAQQALEAQRVTLVG